MKYLITAGLAISLCGCSTVPQPPEFSATQKWQSTDDAHVERGTLINGLEWYALAMPDNGVRDRVEMRLRIRAGSMDEYDQQRGLAHFVEHMAFNGTERFPKHELIDFFESAGVSWGHDINATTGFKDTVYELSLPADKPELIAKGFEVLYDWATAITFDPEEVKKEAPVIVEEWRLRGGSLISANDKEFKDIYRGTRYESRLPIGEMGVVRNATSEQLKYFYNRWYKPDSAEVYVAYPEGALDASLMIRDTFSSWTAEPTESGWSSAGVEIGKPRFMAVTDADQESYAWQLYFPTKSFKYGSPESREAYYIDSIYTYALQARLDRLLEAEGSSLVDAYVDVSAFEDGTDYLGVWASVSDNKSDQALNTLVTELKRLQVYGLTASEYNSAKAQLVNHWESKVRDFENGASNDAMDYLLSRGTVYSYIKSYKDTLRQMKEATNAVSLETVNVYLAQTYNQKNVAGYYYYPQAASVAEEETWPAIYKKAWSADVSAPVEKEVPAWSFEDSYPGNITERFDLLATEGLYQWNLENGFNVVLHPSSLEPGQVQLFSVLFGGKHSLAKELQPAALLWSDAKFKSGLGGLTGQDFVERARVEDIDYGVRLNKASAYNYAAGSVDQIQTLFQLSAESLARTELDPSAVKSIIQSGVEEQEQMQSERGHFINYVEKLGVAIYGEDTIFRPYSSQELTGVTQVQLEAVQKAMLNNSQSALITIVGDITPEQLEPYITEYIAGLPVSINKEAYIKYPAFEGVQTVKVSGQEEDKTDITLYFSNTDAKSGFRESLIAAVAAQTIEKKLMDSIREEAGLTYDISASKVTKSKYLPYSRLKIKFSINPERQVEAIEKLNAQLMLFLKTHFSDAEISETKRQVIQQQQEKLKTNLGIENQLYYAAWFDLPFETYNDYEAYLNDITTEEVNYAVQAWLTGGKVTGIFQP